MAAADSSKPNLLIAEKTPCSWIAEICVKANAEVNFKEENFIESTSLLPMFRVTCKVSAIAGKDFIAVETARSKKAGRQMAANNILVQFGLTPAGLAGMSKKNFADILVFIKRNTEAAPLEVQDLTPKATPEEPTADENSLPKPPMEVLMPPKPVVLETSKEFAKLGNPE